MLLLQHAFSPLEVNTRSLSPRYEGNHGRMAHVHLCIPKAMQQELAAKWGISAAPRSTQQILSPPQNSALNNLASSRSGFPRYERIYGRMAHAPPVRHQSGAAGARGELGR